MKKFYLQIVQSFYTELQCYSYVLWWVQLYMCMHEQLDISCTTWSTSTTAGNTLYLQLIAVIKISTLQMFTVHKIDVMEDQKKKVSFLYSSKYRG